MSYSLQLPGLSDSIARAQDTRAHAQLVAAIRAAGAGELGQAAMATTRGEFWSARRKVLSSDGRLVADDHASWLEAQLAEDAGDGARMIARVRALDLRLTQCDVTKLFLVHDRQGRQQDFVQVDVDQVDEFVDRRLFPSYVPTWRRGLDDVRGLVDFAEEGEPLPERARYAATRYKLRRVVDFAAFLEEAVGVEGMKRAIGRQRVLMVTDVDQAGVHAPRPVTIGELDPDGARYAWRGQRLLDDWTESSAGRSGARLCRHWVFQFADHTDGNGERAMEFVPVWTYGPKIAAIKRLPGSAYALYAKLESIDRRTGVPMGWYFWMLHGNRVEDSAGRRILHALEAGDLVLPEHDYQVLRRWAARPYGF